MLIIYLMTNIAMENRWPIEIDGLAINSMVDLSMANCELVITRWYTFFSMLLHSCYSTTSWGFNQVLGSVTIGATSKKSAGALRGSENWELSKLSGSVRLAVSQWAMECSRIPPDMCISASKWWLGVQFQFMNFCLVNSWWRDWFWWSCSHHKNWIRLRLNVRI